MVRTGVDSRGYLVPVRVRLIVAEKYQNATITYLMS
jgi:hypothetical protein